MCTILPDYDVCLVSKSRSAPGSGATTPVTSAATQESRSEEGLEKKLGMLSMWLPVLNHDSLIFETIIYLFKYQFSCRNIFLTSFIGTFLSKQFLLLQCLWVNTDFFTE